MRKAALNLSHPADMTLSALRAWWYSTARHGPNTVFPIETDGYPDKRTRSAYHRGLVHCVRDGFVKPVPVEGHPGRVVCSECGLRARPHPRVQKLDMDSKPIEPSSYAVSGPVST